MEERVHIPVGPPADNPLPSYWHDPKSPLSNVIEPETDNPAQPYDYGIIGSGISGAMIADFLLLAQPDARLVMIEARDICSGATGRNGGHTKAASYRSYLQHVQELGKDEALKIARLEYQNMTETHRKAAELTVDCEGGICPTIDFIYDQESFERGKRAIQALQADADSEEKGPGCRAYYRIYERDDVIQKNGIVAVQSKNSFLKQEERLAGAFEYVAGSINAYKFTTGILHNCVQRGLRLCTHTLVHDIKPSMHGSNHSQHRMWDIFTQCSTITATNVILATNAYTPYLLKDLQGAIVPMRGQITAQRPGNATTLPNPLHATYSFIYKAGYDYMIPRPLRNNNNKNNTQHIIIGGGLGRLPHDSRASEFGTVDDTRLNPAISAYLRASLPGYFGAANGGEQTEHDASGRIVQEWTGIMGATADGRPFVGEVPGKKGLWVSAGFNGHGMVLCLKSAEALAGMMRTGTVPRWFPESFLVTAERLETTCRFRARTDR